MIEFDGEQGTGQARLSWDRDFMDEKGIVDDMIVVVGINFRTLNNRCSVSFLKGIFDIHINTQDADKSDFLQKLNRFWEEIIACAVLKSEFWSVAFYGHPVQKNKILFYCSQNPLKKQTLDKIFES